MYYNLLLEVATRMDRPVIELVRDQQSSRIIHHYSEQISQGRMDPITATDRAVSDINGHNYARIGPLAAMYLR